MLLDNKLNQWLPRGMSDYLQQPTQDKRMLTNWLRDTFNSFGYMEVETPLLEYYDLFAKHFSNEQHMLYKLFDSDGKILVLRPEMTIPAARLAYSKLQNHPLPIKLSYIGQAFRNFPQRQNEFTQAGVECFGASSPEIDAEIVAMTICAIENVGLSDFSIELGETRIFSSICESAGLDNETRTKILEFIDKKETLAVIQTLSSLDIEPEVKELLVGLGENFGGIEVVENISTKKLPIGTKQALENVRQLYNRLVSWGFEKYISIDLGMVRSFSYYDGMIFKGYSRDLGFVLCGGGRYDGILENMGAAGGCIWVERLMDALIRQGYEFPKTLYDYALLYDEATHNAVFERAMDLRKQGYSVITLDRKSHTYNLSDYARNVQ